MANILSRRNLFRGAAGAALGAAAASIAAVSASAQPNAIAVAALAEFESAGVVDEIAARLKAEQAAADAFFRMGESVGDGLVEGWVDYNSLPYLFAPHFGPPFSFASDQVMLVEEDEDGLLWTTDDGIGWYRLEA